MTSFEVRNNDDLRFKIWKNVIIAGKVGTISGTMGILYEYGTFLHMHVGAETNRIGSILHQGFHLDWKNYKNLQKCEGIFQSGKVREFLTDWKSQGKLHKILAKSGISDK